MYYSTFIVSFILYQDLLSYLLCSSIRNDIINAVTRCGKCECTIEQIVIIKCNGWNTLDTLSNYLLKNGVTDQKQISLILTQTPDDTSRRLIYASKCDFPDANDERDMFFDKLEGLVNITHLHIKLKDQRLEIFEIGIESFPFLGLFPKLVGFTLINERQKPVNIYVVSSLLSLDVGTRSDVKLFCGLSYGNCFEKNMDSLTFISYNNAALSVSTDRETALDLPSEILNVHIEFINQNKDSSPASRIIMKNKKLTSAVIVFKRVNASFFIPDFSGTTITDNFLVNITDDESRPNIRISKALSYGNLYSRMKIISSDLRYSIMPINENQPPQFFGPCEPMRSFFNRRPYENNEKKKTRIVRKFEFDLNELNETFVENYDEINIYTYMLYYSHEGDTGRHYQNKIINIHFIFNFKKPGSQQPADLYYYRFPEGKIKNLVKITDSKINFIQIYKAKVLDAYFTSTVALCLLYKLGDYQKSLANKGNILEPGKGLTELYNALIKRKFYQQNRQDRVDVQRANRIIDFTVRYFNQLLIYDTGFSKVPYLSLEAITRNIDILSDTLEKLQATTRYKSILSNFEELKTLGKAALVTTVKESNSVRLAVLETVARKALNLAVITMANKENICNKLKKLKVYHRKVVQDFQKYSQDVKAEEKNFRKGVKVAIGLAMAEAMAETFNAVFTIFTNGFNPTGVIKATRLAGNLLRKLNEFAKTMFNIGKKILQRGGFGKLFKKFRTSFSNFKNKLKNKLRNMANILKRSLTIKDNNNLNPEFLIEAQRLDKEVLRYDLDKTVKFTSDLNNFGVLLKNPVEMAQAVSTTIKAWRTYNIGYDPEEKNITKITQLFQPDGSLDEMGNSNSATAYDVFEWAIGKEQVTGNDICLVVFYMSTFPLYF